MPHLQAPSPSGGDSLLIVTADTGGGHASAAKALMDGMRRFQPQAFESIHTARALEESNLLVRGLAGFYNVLLRHSQQNVKHYYRLIERLRPNESGFLFWLTYPYTRRLLLKRPRVLVSVHPMTQQSLARALRHLQLDRQIPMITVVTDPCRQFWVGWACDDVQHYYVATQAAHHQLCEFGIPADRITITGLPVHPRFQPCTAEEQETARRELHLDPGKFTVFINAGWVGGGNIPRIFEHLAANGQPLANMQAVFLAGRNAELKHRIERLAQEAPFNVRVLGYTERMDQLMQAADIMVSKLGGLTTFEALNSHLPIVADATTPPMPQEAETVRYLDQHQAGLILHCIEDIVPLLQTLRDQPGELQRLRNGAAHIARPDATRHIVAAIVQHAQQASLCSDREPTPALSV